MLALVVSVCLKTDPAHCTDHVVAWLPKQSATTCLVDTTPLVAEYSRENPDMVIKSVICMRKTR